MLHREGLRERRDAETPGRVEHSLVSRPRTIFTRAICLSSTIREYFRRGCLACAYPAVARSSACSLQIWTIKRGGKGDGMRWCTPDKSCSPEHK